MAVSEKPYLPHRRPHLYVVHPAEPADGDMPLNAYHSQMSRFLGIVGHHRQPLDVYLMNQKECDPFFTSCEGTFMESVTGFKQGLGHCFTGTRDQTCCRVFNADGFRCQSMGHQVTLTELDPDWRVLDAVTPYTILQFRDPVHSKALVRTTETLGEGRYTPDRALFFLCDHHTELLEMFFRHHNDLSFSESEPWTNIAFNLAAPSALAAAESSFLSMANLTSTLMEMLSTVLSVDTHQPWYMPLIQLARAWFPARQLWRKLDVPHDQVVEQFNYYFKLLPPHIKTAPFLMHLHQFINGVRIDMNVAPQPLRALKKSASVPPSLPPPPPSSSSASSSRATPPPGSSTSSAASMSPPTLPPGSLVQFWSKLPESPQPGRHSTAFAPVPRRPSAAAAASDRLIMSDDGFVHVAR